MLYLALFLSFFKIGLFGFGGGLAILSLIEMEVERHGWMTQQEFVDIVAVSHQLRHLCRLYDGGVLGKCAGHICHCSTEPHHHALYLQGVFLVEQ